MITLFYMALAGPRRRAIFRTRYEGDQLSPPLVVADQGSCFTVGGVSRALRVSFISVWTAALATSTRWLNDRNWVSEDDRACSAVRLARSSSTSAKPPAGHPFTGTGTGTFTLNITTGMGTTVGTAHFSPLGTATDHETDTFTLTSPTATTFTVTGKRTFLFVNGSKLFASFTGPGEFTSATTAKSTETGSITGGTGQFVGARGTFTGTVTAVATSKTATTEVSRVSITSQGHINY